MANEINPRLGGSVLAADLDPEASAGVPLAETLAAGRFELAPLEDGRDVGAIAAWCDRCVWDTRNPVPPDFAELGAVTGGLVRGVPLFPATDVDGVAIGTPVYYRPDKALLSLEAGTAGILAGFVHATQWALSRPASNNNPFTSWRVHGGGNDEIDLYYALDGAERIAVNSGSSGTFTVEGNGEELAVLQTGQAGRWRYDGEAGKWEVSDKPLRVASVWLSTGSLRARALAGSPARLRPVASWAVTTGPEPAPVLTVEPNAPARYSADDDGRLVIADVRRGAALVLTASHPDHGSDVQIGPLDGTPRLLYFLGRLALVTLTPGEDGDLVKVAIRPGGPAGKAVAITAAEILAG